MSTINAVVYASLLAKKCICVLSATKVFADSAFMRMRLILSIADSVWTLSLQMRLLRTRINVVDTWSVPYAFPSSKSQFLRDVTNFTTTYATSASGIQLKSTSRRKVSMLYFKSLLSTKESSSFLRNKICSPSS